MPQVIEWKTVGLEDIVWRYPVEELSWGAQLIVHEYEVAVFFRDGKAYDVFGPGRHTITTMNVPLLRSAFKLFYGETPFKATIIFVATKQFAGKWGARAQTTELAPLLVHGSFWFKISDPSLFVNEVVGGKGAYTTSEVNEFLKGFINEQTIDELSRYDLATVFTKLDETSTIVKTHIGEALKRFGTDLVDLKFEGIDTTPEFRDRLFWLKTTTPTSEVLRMETLKEVGKEMAKAPGAAIGTGMVLIPQMTQPTAAPAMPTVALLVCSNCNTQIPAASKFCPSCGVAIAVKPSTQKNCPNCGKQISVDAKFCPECGQKLT
ncbi:MAG: SPFH domain-containing protein [archaeon]|nr:SPFH domain-containing protein [archaeon]MCP8312852.1 SPFH domain-containing protein [archaeon]MCP8317996.1 SPFH domain-containing protein [archaeon]MCP8319661.1 SPFH domain-containing protein [archaeon]